MASNSSAAGKPPVVAKRWLAAQFSPFFEINVNFLFKISHDKLSSETDTQTQSFGKPVERPGRKASGPGIKHGIAGLQQVFGGSPPS
jgi:hypothetical protein